MRTGGLKYSLFLWTGVILNEADVILSEADVILSEAKNLFIRSFAGAQDDKNLMTLVIYYDIIITCV